MKLVTFVLAALLGSAPLVASADEPVLTPPGGPVYEPQGPVAPQQRMRGQRGPRGQRGQRGQKGQMKRMLLQRFDQNGDGRLGPREQRQALRAVRKLERRLAAAERKGQIRRLDKNRDGNLGPGETPPRLRRQLQRFDQNGDGWVSPGE